MRNGNWRSNSARIVLSSQGPSNVTSFECPFKTGELSKRHMKIALCKTTMLGPISGADEIMLNYAVHLHNGGHDVRVVLLYQPTLSDQYLQRLKLSGVPFTIVVTRSYSFRLIRVLRHLCTALFFLFVLKRFRERLRKIWQVALNLITHFHYRKCRAYFARHRVDLLHVFTPDAGATMIIRAGHALGIPVLYHEMGTAHHLPALNNYYNRLEKVLPLCAEFAALSPRLASQWKVRFPFLRSVSVLPLMVEYAETFDFRMGLNSRPEQTVFGFSARVEEGKGPLLLLEALARVNSKEPVARTKIAGNGPQLAEVKERARALALADTCQFVGQYSEPLTRAAFMKSLDVFVLPSLAEGTPNSVIEAMAHGLPIIATEVGGIPDVLDDDCGILVPAGDGAALADAMKQLAQDPLRLKAMGNAARKRYEKLFAPTVVLPVLLETYQRLASNGKYVKNAASGNGYHHPWTQC